MVLQRGVNVEVWGWADPGEKILVRFIDRTHGAITDPDGKWTVVLPIMGPGGPFEMSILGSDTAITVRDILIGDVWVCSGQSNMELSIRRESWVYPYEIEHSEN
jgi:sialate O-acetylesterase